MHLTPHLQLLDYLLQKRSRRDVLDTFEAFPELPHGVTRDSFKSSLEHELKQKMLREQVNGRLSLDYLEMDIVAGCNLTCGGCSHYSNYARLTKLPFEEGRKWMEDWSAKLSPKIFRLLGGEPALNPELTKFVRLAYELWPNADRSVASNGLVFKLQPEEFFQTMGETKTGIQITIHSTDEKFAKKLNKPWLEEKSRMYGFPLLFGESIPEQHFRRLYRGEGADMMPYQDNDEFGSWLNCAEKHCPTIHQGRLWICPPIAFLKLMDDKFNISEKPEWRCALAHKGIKPESSLEQIATYLNSALKFCSMCPAHKSYPDDEPLKDGPLRIID